MTRLFLSFICVSVFLFANAERAEATRFSGAYLLHVCSMSADGQEIVRGGHNACQSYISGIVDYYNLMKSLGVMPGMGFCIPNNEPLPRLQRIVVAYISKNKVQHYNFTAAPAVIMALNNSYPC